MSWLKGLGAGAAFAVLSLAAALPAAAFTLSNSNGGDGHVNAITGGFDLVGADNGAGPNLTLYTETAATTGTLQADYAYSTSDPGGPEFDPAGLYLGANDRFAQLSPSASGSIRFHVTAGETYGFYVNSSDSAFGAGDIAITNLAAGVPEPAAWALMLVGFGALGARVRLQRRAKQASTAA